MTLPARFRFRSTPVLAGLLAVSLGLGGCATVTDTLGKLNPLGSKEDKDAPKAAEGERIALSAFDQTLKAEDGLKGLDFFLPEPETRLDWPYPGGTPEQSVEHVTGAQSFSIAWKKSIGEGTGDKGIVVAPPVIADGRLFAMDARATVSAIDAASGQAIWRKDLRPKSKRDQDGFGGGLAVVDGVLYVTSGFRFVAALDPATGAVKWQTSTASPVHAAPNVSAGRLFTVSTDNELLTFETASGAPSWDYQAIVEPARILAASSPAVSGETVIAAFASGELMAFRTTNGNELWSEVLSRSSRTNALSEIRDVAGRPLIYRGDVFAISHSGVFSAIDLRSGQTRWSLPFTGTTSPWASGDVIFATSTAGEVICASRENGQIYWIRDLNEGREKKERAFWSGPLLASGNLLVTSSQGEAVRIDAKTGDLKGKLKLGSGSVISPISANGLAYVLTDDGQIVAIR